MRFLVFLAGLAMAGSYFVTWIEPPFAGPEFSPNAIIGLGDELQRLISEGPWQAWVFLGGFALAGLAALVSIVGRASGLLALLAGLSPVVLGVHYYTRVDEFRQTLNIPFEIDVADLNATWEVMEDFVRAGLWMYAGGAVVLLLAGLTLSFGSR